MNSIDLADRAKLAKEVFDRVFENTETFREDNLGADLAYLLGAILDTEQPQAGVDWSEDCDETLERFRSLFPANHEVWTFIVEPSHGATEPVTDDERSNGPKRR